MHLSMSCARFFFSSRRRHTRWPRDWSSDVCSSDLTKPASNRTELNRHLAGTVPSLIILDLRLGQDDGLDLLREIRSLSDVPVIITTGHRADEIDRIVGLALQLPFSEMSALCGGLAGPA